MHTSLLQKARDYEDAHVQQMQQEIRPVFHVSSRNGWMNDPNGFSYFQGKTHLFHQYYPYASHWGPMHWAHLTTTDFVQWTLQPAALAPDLECDAAGCFSGTAIADGDKHVLMYTGVRETKYLDGTTQSKQDQCIAIGDGVHYEKFPLQVISGTQLPAQFNKEDFRDPKLWKEGNTYFAAIANRKEKGLGQVVLFRCENLRDWQYVSVLAENDGRYGKMWECPDFFTLADTKVLIVSPQNMEASKDLEFHNGHNAVYFTGTYDDTNYQFHAQQVRSLDYGLDFYAPQTMLSGDGRRIMIAWMQSWDNQLWPEQQKWAGMMTIPRELHMENGEIIQTPVRELENYRANPVKYHDKAIEGTCQLAGISGRVMDLSIALTAGDYRQFTIRFAVDETHCTTLVYDKAQQLLTFDRMFSGMTRDLLDRRTMKIKSTSEPLQLRILLDTYSAEIFVNGGKQTFSNVFYTPLTAQDIEFSCDGKAIVNIEKFDIVLH